MAQPPPSLLKDTWMRKNNCLKWALDLIFLFSCLGILALPLPSGAQQINNEGWPVPDLKGLTPYSISMKKTDGIEKVTEKFVTPSGGHIARIIGNGNVFAYAVDSDQEPPIDYLLLDPDGSGKFTQKIGPADSYAIPDWVSN